VKTIRTDVAIIGGGLGGGAAALAAAARLGRRVVLTEETRWLNGQALLAAHGVERSWPSLTPL
jgi:flavin-dependent dehydrogenase